MALIAFPHWRGSIGNVNSVSPEPFLTCVCHLGYSLPLFEFLSKMKSRIKSSHPWSFAHFFQDSGSGTNWNILVKRPFFAGEPLQWPHTLLTSSSSLGLLEHAITTHFEPRTHLLNLLKRRKFISSLNTSSSALKSSSKRMIPPLPVLTDFPFSSTNTPPLALSSSILFTSSSPTSWYDGSQDLGASVDLNCEEPLMISSILSWFSSSIDSR